MITIYGKEACSYCTMSKKLSESKNVDYKYLQLGVDYEMQDFQEKFPGARTFPQILVNEKAIGGFNELRNYFDA